MYGNILSGVTEYRVEPSSFLCLYVITRWEVVRDMFSFADVLLFATFILALLTYIDKLKK